MRIELSSAGKRFNREWIFRNLDLQLNLNDSLAIVGPNGSGKSTLLQCIGNLMDLSEGKREISDTNLPTAVSLAAPYLEVIEEMTLVEFLNFHSEFQPLHPELSVEKVIGFMKLERSAGKQIRYFSSGMKQRVKLAQAFFSDSSILLLDEPCSNLDQEGINWYHSLCNEFVADRITIVSSNDTIEYNFCKRKISIQDYKV